MQKEAEVETFSNSFLFILLKVLIVSSIGQNLMIIFIFNGRDKGLKSYIGPLILSEDVKWPKDRQLFHKASHLRPHEQRMNPRLSEERLILERGKCSSIVNGSHQNDPPPPPGGSGDKGMPQENTRFKETQKYLRENCYHCIKCITTTFLAAFMWRGPLNSVTLTTTTHKRSERVFDGMGTQVAVQMIDKCKIKMIQRGIHKMRDALPQRRGKRKKREDGST